MTIYRLTIEAIVGDGTEELAALRADVRDTDGIVLYDEGATEGWGVPFTPGAFTLDFDSESAEGIEVDAACMEKVKAFVLRR